VQVYIHDIHRTVPTILVILWRTQIQKYQTIINGHFHLNIRAIIRWNPHHLQNYALLQIFYRNTFIPISIKDSCSFLQEYISLHSM